MLTYIILITSLLIQTLIIHTTEKPTTQFQNTKTLLKSLINYIIFLTTISTTYLILLKFLLKFFGGFKIDRISKINKMSFFHVFYYLLILINYSDMVLQNKIEFILVIFAFFINCVTKSFCLLILNFLKEKNENLKNFWRQVTVFCLVFFFWGVLEALSFLDDGVYLKIIFFHGFQNSLFLTLLCFLEFLKESESIKQNRSLKFSFLVFSEFLYQLTELYFCYSLLLMSIKNDFLINIIKIKFLNHLYSLISKVRNFLLAINLFKAKKKKNLKIENQKNCSICFCKIEESIVLKCSHSFHFKCIENFFLFSSNKKCPYCGKNIEFWGSSDEKKFLEERKSFFKGVCFGEELTGGEEFKEVRVEREGNDAWGFEELKKVLEYAVLEKRIY